MKDERLGFRVAPGCLAFHLHLQVRYNNLVEVDDDNFYFPL
jgi:hypothetical protein